MQFRSSFSLSLSLYGFVLNNPSGNDSEPPVKIPKLQLFIGIAIGIDSDTYLGVFLCMRSANAEASSDLENKGISLLRAAWFALGLQTVAYPYPRHRLLKATFDAEVSRTASFSSNCNIEINRKVVKRSSGQQVSPFVEVSGPRDFHDFSSNNCLPRPPQLENALIMDRYN